MPPDNWSNIHSRYKKEDWIDKPSLFAQTAIAYFPETGKILELGAGQGQDARFFAGQGYDVISTDSSDSALALNKAKLPQGLKGKITIQNLDISKGFPFPDESFDIVYAHLSLHYFDHDTTIKIFHEIERVLRKGGILAFLVNSTNDPEYQEGEKIEKDFFRVEGMTKRYFTVETAKTFAAHFETLLLDNKGETYKDSAKGIYNLIRFIGVKK